MKIRSLTAPNPGPFTLDGTRTYLLGDTAVLDPGPAIDSHIEAIRASQPGLKTILITHRHADHAPAAAALKRMTGATVFAPVNVFDDGTVDVLISGGEHLPIESETLTVLATPGHTAEHVCFLTTEGELFSGDMILGRGTTTIFPPDGHMGDYLRSLAMLRARAPRTIHPGHGPSRDDGVALIDEYVAHRLDRESQILAAIDAGTSTVDAMRDRIYPEIDPRLTEAATVQLRAHLIKLEEEGRIEQAHDRYVRSR